jgi:hypothetical protein
MTRKSPYRRQRPTTTPGRFSLLAYKRAREIRDGTSVRFVRTTYRRQQASEYRSPQAFYLRHTLRLLDWLDTMAALVGAVEPVERTKEFMEFRLSRLHPDIRIFVTAVAIGVAFYRDGECFDLLADIDVAPEQMVGGWLNNFRLPESRVVFRDLDDLWRIEIFNPFRDWMRTKLIPAQVLIVHALDEQGATWTKLADATATVDPYEVVRLPVWIDSSFYAESA